MHLAIIAAWNATSPATPSSPAAGRSDVLVSVDQGEIVAVETGASGPQPLAGPVLPGMANLHSHAFQRAMAGLTELRGGAEDDFWTWRELMYRFVERLTPDQAQVVAHFLYIDLLRHGYTAVAEFHYVHRPDGMLQAHLDAAREAGIAITLLPSVYRWSGFGEQPLQARQQALRARHRCRARGVCGPRGARDAGRENRGGAALAARGRSGCARGARRRSPARRADPHPRRGADA